MRTFLIPGLVAIVAAFVFLVAEDALGAAAPFVKAVPVAILSYVVSLAGPRPGKGRARISGIFGLAAMGLACAALADWVIEYSFLGGLVTFLVTHLFYIAAFIMMERTLKGWRLVPVVVWAALALPVLSGGAGALRLPVLIYGTVIFVMIWRAAATVSGLGRNAATFTFAGALLFGLSDTLLGYNRFVSPLPASGFLILGTYWAAQTMIATAFACPEPSS